MLYDGDLTTAWATVTDVSPPRAYAVLDLGAVQPVGTIRWLFALPGLADGMAVRVSEDGESWMTLVTPGNDEAGVWQEYNASVTARFIRFAFVDTGQSATLGGLAEVEIWPATGEVTRPLIDLAAPDVDNVPVEQAAPTAAAGAPAAIGPFPIVASDSSDNATGSWVVYDGDSNSFWATNTEAPVAEASLTLDLGAVWAIGTLRYLIAVGGLGDSMQIVVSSDGANWFQAGQVGTGAPGVWQDAWLGVEARYIRLIFPNPGGLTQLGGLAEIEIWP
jgi:hypothetical protein